MTENGAERDADGQCPPGDWLGRSLIDLLGTIQQLETCGVDLYLDQQAIDTTTPTGRLMFQITGAFAEFERSMIRQRIRAGLRRAVEAGKQLGRPKINPTLEKTNPESITGRQGHVGDCQGVQSWHRHGPAHCTGNGSCSPFRRRKRGRVKASAQS
jgi:hypothetical protein